MDNMFDCSPESKRSEKDMNHAGSVPRDEWFQMG